MGLLTVPHRLADVDLGWLAAALRRFDGRLAGCRVTPIAGDFGFASEIGRVALHWDPPLRGPASVVVKLSDRPAEAHFYRDIGDYAGIRVPHCHHAATAGDRTALVLEDLAGARFGDFLRPEGAGELVDALADMHARWWDSPRLAELGWLPGFGPPPEARLAELPDHRESFFARHGDQVPAAVRAWTEAIGPAVAVPLARLAGPPATLLHVDCHADNVAFAGGEPVVFDWQRPARGAAAVDLAHWLGTALLPEERDAEPALFARYRRRLGIDHPGLRDEYRLATLRWWIGVVHGLGSPAAAAWTGRQAEVARAAVPRMVAAVTDLAVAELL